MMATPTLALPAPRPRTPSIAVPLVLIALGGAFLAANLGYLSGLRWSDVLRLWPVLIILAGTDLLLRPRSFVAAAAVEITIIALAFAYLISGVTPAAVGANYTLNVPRAAASDLNLTVNYGAGTFALTGGGSDLVAVRSSQEDVTRTIDQNGGFAAVTLSSNRPDFMWMGGDRRWDVQLPSDVRTGMTLNLGAGDFDVDLTTVQLTRATINAGASDLTVRLPAQVKGDVRMTVAAGASDVKLYVPQGLAYRVTYSGVAMSATGPTESASYATASDRITINVSAAAGSLSIR
jgi:cell wall-active antibiotic response 4TMS protein YvqF